MTIPWSDDRPAPPIAPATAPSAAAHRRPVYRPTSHRPPGFGPSGDQTPDLPRSVAADTDGRLPIDDDDDQAHLRGARGVINGLAISLFGWLAVAGLFSLAGFVVGFLLGQGTQ